MGHHARSCVLSRLADRWDNDDVRVRPGRGTRPRTKTRPAHAESETGMVLTVDRGRFGCLVGTGRRRRTVVGMRARELGRGAVVVGDRVELVGDLSGEPDTLARIVRVAPRTSVLRRSADDQVDADSGAPVGAAAGEKVLVANADLLVMVTALADPEPRPGFIDRCLVAAYTGGLEPVLVLTKADLADPAELLAAYADLDLPVVVSRRAGTVLPSTPAMSDAAAGGSDPGGATPSGAAVDPAAPDSAGSQGAAVSGSALDAAALAEVTDLVSGRMSVLVGHSGVGKSTLVNALVPAAERATGDVTGVGKGRHTSTSAVALELPGGGWIVDTPGVRSFGLAHVTADDLLETFDDLLPATVDCPPGCDHSGPDGGPNSTGTGCALDAYVASGRARPSRLASFRRLLASRSGGAEDVRTEGPRPG